jgi:hypothetical protein
MRTKKTADDAPINDPLVMLLDKTADKIAGVMIEDRKKIINAVLETLITQGLTFSDCVHFFSKQQTPEELEYAEIAKNDMEQEGELEFDDVPIVSKADTEHGAYVMAWVWIPGPDEEEEEENE